MANFKDSNVAAIEKARKDLEAKIQSEKEALSKNRGEVQTTEGGAGGNVDGEDNAADQQNK